MKVNGDAAREFRTIRGFTVRQAAAAIGRSISAISGIENGHHGASPELIDQLAELYGVAPSALLRDPEDRVDERIAGLEERIAALEAEIFPHRHKH